MWGVVLAVLVTSGVMGYFWVKQSAAQQARHDQETALLRVQNRENLEAIGALSVAIEAMRESYVTLEKDKRRVQRKLEEVKKRDEESRTYLERPVPNGVRDVVKASGCLQVPGSCYLNETHSSGVPGDSND